MTNAEIVSKLWNLCNVLRDDGITYHQYVTELTYILFLKMAKETGSEKNIPEDYRWDALKIKEGMELKRFYEELLRELGENCSGRVQEIYQGARSNIEEPANLKKIITNIDELDWYSAKEEGLGNLYEGLLEKNANEKKSGAGQYFTPRVLIDVMTELIAPQPGERCNDPACGTFGFMIAADRYVKEHTNDWMDLTEEEAAFEQKEAFTNPPFGTKKGGERANRDDFTYQTSNKQLNFLQHIYRSLKADGKARAAVVLPDNVLFADGEGERIRADLMDKCNLYTVLRLPTGIFYAQGVKTNVLFFRRGTTDHNNTEEVWFYDLRTNMPSFGKTNPLKYEHFKDFIAAYTAKDRHAVEDERWNVFTREELGNTLDKGLIRDDSVLDYEDLPDPIESGEECISQLEEAVDLLKSVVKELKSLESTEV